MRFKEAKKLASAGPSKAAINTNGESSVEAGQTTLDGMKAGANGTNGVGANGNDVSLVSDDEEEGDDPNAQLEKEARRARLSTGSTISEGQQGGDVEMN